MAEMISSAVVQEAVSQILSGLVHKCEGKEKSNANENMDRLEMAHIRLEAALEISNKWLITDASLLRWRNKLKLTAQQCDDALHKCKQRILEEQIEQEVRNSSFPKRMAHATKSFILSSFSSNKDEPSRSVIRRFEWFAHGASKFLRFVEHGSLHCHMPVNSMIKHIFAGNELRHKIVQGSECPMFLLSVMPFRNAEHGIEISLTIIQKDGSAPENDFFLGVMLQISESTDIIGTIIKCLQLYTVHFRSAVEIIRKQLTQLPMQDLSWVPPSCVDPCQKEHWKNIHSFSSQWFRSNPLCCKHHVQHKFCQNSKVDRSGLQDVSLESVIIVNLQCQVSSSEYSKQSTSMFKGKCSLQDSPHLKVGLLFTPHGTSEDLLLADRSSELVMIDGGEEQKFLQADVTLDRLEEILLPKAIDYFSQNSEATAYQMLWKSKCGSRAYIQVEKTSIFLPRTQRTFGAARKRKLLQQQDKELASPTNVISHFMDLWATHAPNKLQASIMDWNQKEKEEQLAPQLPCLKSRLGDGNGVFQGGSQVGVRIHNREQICHDIKV